MLNVIKLIYSNHSNISKPFTGMKFEFTAAAFDRLKIPKKKEISRRSHTNETKTYKGSAASKGIRPACDRDRERKKKTLIRARNVTFQGSQLSHGIALRLCVAVPRHLFPKTFPPLSLSLLCARKIIYVSACESLSWTSESWLGEK